MTQKAYHKPVLLHEAVHYLISDPSGVYVDGTLGGGGHSEQILRKLSRKGMLYAVDQDEDALAFSTEKFKDESRISIVQGNFAYLDVILPKSARGSIDGILLDLGVSSHQIDEPGRGFSFQKDGPLDMRMSVLQDRTAAQLVNELEFHELRNLLFSYGEDRRSSAIARALVAARPLHTTGQMCRVIDSVVPERFRNKTRARIFQALRIAVNEELEMLKQFLNKSCTLLASEGRLVVITYHSLEDRICKNFFRFGNFEGVPQKDFYGHDIRPMKSLASKVVTPGENELEQNPRARSAKLRAAVRIPDFSGHLPDPHHPGRRGITFKSNKSTGGFS